MTNEKNRHVEPNEKLPTTGKMDQSTNTLLTVSGMGCPSCAARVRNSLLQLQGVVEARVDHMSGAAQVVYNKMMVNESDMVQAVVRAGGDGRHNYSAQIRK